MWFTQRRSRGTPVGGPLLAEKVKQLLLKIHEGNSDVPEFTASSGWLWCFCKRHGILQLSIEGE